MYSRSSYRFLLWENETMNRSMIRGSKTFPPKTQTTRGESTSWTILSISSSREIVNWVAMCRSEPKQRTPQSKQISQVSGKERSKSLPKLRTVALSTPSKTKPKNFGSKSRWKRIQLIMRDSVTKISNKNWITSTMHFKRKSDRSVEKMLYWKKTRTRKLRPSTNSMSNFKILQGTFQSNSRLLLGRLWTLQQRCRHLACNLMALSRLRLSTWVIRNLPNMSKWPIRSHHNRRRARYL